MALAWADQEAAEEQQRARHYEQLVRAVAPEVDQVAARQLPAAAERHATRLREDAVRLRVQAVTLAPASPLYGPAWVSPYSKIAAEAIQDADAWYADLPHQLLQGWRHAGDAWTAEERTARRDTLTRWAIRLGLPKATVAAASGVARTTVDRVLAN
ncbi:hypothetical protein [Streptomyces sp. SM12]|uniref:hypothetical protein n=1 Tax=Streptomyces sp. SM12 TaxID=1071602 RepID=UPI000CD594C2|nr:hypothetical protein [Streptomyces sp. SM12]